jgi:demethoxyubiquinone hydroxylase (CLK1/Coq7/Cat5 family)
MVKDHYESELKQVNAENAKLLAQLRQIKEIVAVV